MPRPRILDQQKQQELCKLIHLGFNLASAAQHIGCSVLTVRRESQRNPQFAGQLRQAQFSQDANPVRTLSLAAAHNWRAAAWLLERTQPQRYARRNADSFSPQEVAELLDRVCHAVGKETRDAHLSDRIRRRALALANSRLPQRGQNPFRAQLATVATTPPQVLEAAQTASSVAETQPASHEPSRAPKNQKIVLLRASDFARSETPTVAAPQAS